jgi:hypothetical protein
LLFFVMIVVMKCPFDLICLSVNAISRDYLFRSKSRPYMSYKYECTSFHVT